jgi:hypothetical protein
LDLEHLSDRIVPSSTPAPDPAGDVVVAGFPTAGVGLVRFSAAQGTQQLTALNPNQFAVARDESVVADFAGL